MFRHLIRRLDFRSTRLWSVAKTAAVTAVLIRFGPLLFSLSSGGWNGVPFVTAVGCLTRIPEAIETAREEKHRTTSERAAFERFATEIRQLDTTANPGNTVDGALLRDPVGAAGESTDAVRELYRETVMSVDHYEADYDEPLVMNITAELGPDVGTAITATDTLEPPLQRALARASESAADERAEFESLVESELQSLSTAEDRIRNVADPLEQLADRDFQRRPFDGIEEITTQLQTAEQECESLIADRQSEYVDAPEEGGLNFKEYLYEQHDWTYPVVGDALEVISTVREVEERILTGVFNNR